MRELAPQDKDGSYVRPVYSFQVLIADFARLDPRRQIRSAVLLNLLHSEYAAIPPGFFERKHEAL